MKNIKTNVYLKLGVIAFLVLILLIPTSIVRSLIKERENTQLLAISEVSEKWGNGQEITGPFISIPYDKYLKKYSKKDSTSTVVRVREYIHLLPKNLNIKGNISPEKKYRGIYEVVVYDSKVKVSGNFSEIDLSVLDIISDNIHFDKATLNIGISDLKGIEKQVNVNWMNKELNFNSGLSNNDVVSSGINVKLSNFKTTDFNDFSLSISIKGSQYLYFLPFGKTTDVHIKSDWTTPSFTGKYLPDSRTVNEEGFDAKWNVLHLNRNYPQVWKGDGVNTLSSYFGIDLLLPMDNYKKSDRISKYAILFLGLTFLVFFFIEILNKVFIHPVQYILVGLAIIVFYVLLLSFSEHVYFNIAYLMAALLTLASVSLYVYAILKSKKLASIVFGMLLILYLFIFIIIQLEGYALLVGSIGLFTILSSVMYFSRKIDWYNLKQ